MRPAKSAAQPNLHLLTAQPLLRCATAEQLAYDKRQECEESGNTFLIRGGGGGGAENCFFPRRTRRGAENCFFPRRNTEGHGERHKGKTVIRQRSPSPGLSTGSSRGKLRVLLAMQSNPAAGLPRFEKSAWSVCVHMTVDQGRSGIVHF